MITFITSEYQYFAKYFSKRNISIGKYEAIKFKNGTTLVSLKTKVTGEKCVVVGGVVPESSLAEFLLLAHTLKKEGAKNIVAVFPNIPYARQDENKSMESWGIEWLGEICRASGIDEVVTLDIHSLEAKKSFSVPLVSLSAANILAESVKKKIKANTICVAPDEGAIDNCLDIIKPLSINLPVSYFIKHRNKSGIKMISLKGSVGESVVIVDDILDTGETLLAAAKHLIRKGVLDINVIITHGLFTGSIWEKLFQNGVKNIYCTDSNPGALYLASRNIIVVPCGDIFAKYFYEIKDGEN